MSLTDEDDEEGYQSSHNAMVELPDLITDPSSSVSSLSSAEQEGNSSLDEENVDSEQVVRPLIEEVLENAAKVARKPMRSNKDLFGRALDALKAVEDEAKEGKVKQDPQKQGEQIDIFFSRLLCCFTSAECYISFIASKIV